LLTALDSLPSFEPNKNKALYAAKINETNKTPQQSQEAETGRIEV
jgi:hypothetical protein